MKSVSSPFWSHLTLTGFDQQTVARVTLGQIWASLLRSRSASALVPVPRHALTAHERSLDSASRWEVTGQRFWEMRGCLVDLASAELPAGWPHTGPLALHVQQQKNCPTELSLPTDFWEITSCCFKPLGLLYNNKLLKHYSSGIYRQNLSFPTCNSKSWSFFLILSYFITTSCLI